MLSSVAAVRARSSLRLQPRRVWCRLTGSPMPKCRRRAATPLRKAWGKSIGTWHVYWTTEDREVGSARRKGETHMTRFKNIVVAAALAVAITVAAGAAYAGTPTHPVSKCQDFACQL